MSEKPADIFELTAGQGDNKSKGSKQKPPKKKAAETKAEKRRAAKKKSAPPVEGEAPPEEPTGEENLTPDDLQVSEEASNTSEVRIADSADRNVVEDQSSLLDTLPRAEDAVTKAKRENPEVADWDAFLAGLDRGTAEQIFEMGIVGLKQGERPLTNFRRSDLVKPKGPMLDQHADAIEGELAKLDMVLLPEQQQVRPPSAEARQAREERLRNLRSTM